MKEELGRKEVSCGLELAVARESGQRIQFDSNALASHAQSPGFSLVLAIQEIGGKTVGKISKAGFTSHPSSRVS